MRRLVLDGAALAALLASVIAPSAAAAGKVKLDLYVMSLCPFGVQAENGILPAVKKLDKHVDLGLYFIGGQSPNPPGLPTYTALHGQPEVDENIRQVCAMKLYPGKWMDYVLERNKNYRQPEWTAAAKAAGLDPAKVEDCAKGPQGSAWYSKSLSVSEARGASGSPTIDIAGKPYTRGRGEAAVTAALCDAIKAGGSAEPALCAQARADAAKEPAAAAGGGCAEPGAPGQAAGAPAAFDITVVTEESCPICAPTLLKNMAGLHPGAKIRTLDAGSKEGRELLEKHGAKTLPLYVLDSGVEQDPNFSRLLPVAYYKSRDAYLIRHGPTNFYPNSWLERERKPRHLDIFLESLSPASIQAEQDLIRFLGEHKDRLGALTISIHFLAREATVAERGSPEASAGAVRSASLAELAGRPGELSSPRGDAEIEEDIRQLCLFQHAPLAAYLDYLACRHQNLQSLEWTRSCVPKAEPRSQACAKGKEGRELLRKDARLARELDLTRAPAFLWENRYGPFGWNEADWRGLLLGRYGAAKR